MLVMEDAIASNLEVFAMRRFSFHLLPPQILISCYCTVALFESYSMLRRHDSTACYTASSSVFVPSHVDVWSHGRKLKDQYHAQSLEIRPIRVLRSYGGRKLNTMQYHAQ